MNAKLNDDLLVFCDLETTGLNPHAEHILEIGMVIYDRKKDEIMDQCSWVTRPTERSPSDPTRHRIMDVETIMAKTDQYVVDMHTKNSLWKDLAGTTQTLFDAGAQIPEWFAMNGLPVKGVQYIMAGNGIDRFDRPWIRHYANPLRGLDSLFHYRSLDLSNLFYAFKYAGVDLNEGRPERPESNHRAIDDCLWSLEDWLHFNAKLKDWSYHVPHGLG